MVKDNKDKHHHSFDELRSKLLHRTGGKIYLKSDEVEQVIRFAKIAGLDESCSPTQVIREMLSLTSSITNARSQPFIDLMLFTLVVLSSNNSFTESDLRRPQDFLTETIKKNPFVSLIAVTNKRLSLSVRRFYTNLNNLDASSRKKIWYDVQALVREIRHEPNGLIERLVDEVTQIGIGDKPLDANVEFDVVAWQARLAHLIISLKANTPETRAWLVRVGGSKRQWFSEHTEIATTEAVITDFCLDNNIEELILWVEQHPSESFRNYLNKLSEIEFFKRDNMDHLPFLRESTINFRANPKEAITLIAGQLVEIYSYEFMRAHDLRDFQKRLKGYLKTELKHFIEMHKG